MQRNGAGSGFRASGGVALACALAVLLALPGAAYAGPTQLGLRVWDSSQNQGSGEGGQPGSTQLGIRVTDSSSSAPLTVQVSFDPCDGSAPTVQDVAYNSPIPRPSTDPAREGYVFKGWFDAPSGGSPHDFSTPVMGDIVLYAQWEAVVRTVSFETNGGTKIDDQQVPFGSTIEEPAAPTRDGYGFVAWYESPDFSGSPWDFSTPMPAKDITLYAKWTLRIECSIPSAARLKIDGSGAVEGDAQPFVSTTVVPLKVSSATIVEEVDAASVFPDPSSRANVRIVLSDPSRPDSKAELSLALDDSVQTDFLIPEKGSFSVGFGLALPKGTKVDYSDAERDVVKLCYVVEPAVQER